MNFKLGKAGQAQIIRAIQKDAINTSNLTEDVFDLLKFACGPKIWIRYNHLCKLLTEISYHGFLSLNRLQTLGEEYTGIIQVDNDCVSLPNRCIQLTAIILEFGGESLYYKILDKFEKDLETNNELRPEAKNLLLKIISLMRFLTPYIKGFHKGMFYLNANKYQISKRLCGINYILIRNWLHSNQPLYGYRILGFLTFFQLTLSLILNMKKIKNVFYNNKDNISNLVQVTSSSSLSPEAAITNEDILQPEDTCQLCLDKRKNSSVTLCGHLFCWECIIGWLNERSECPICRETIRKSNVVQLINY